jgi:hypothetical protein
MAVLSGWRKRDDRVDEGSKPRRRSTGFQLRAPSRFRFPTVDYSFHLHDSNRNQFHLLPTITLAPNRRAIDRGDAVRCGMNSVKCGHGRGQSEVRRHNQAARPARCGRGKSKEGGVVHMGQSGLR